MPHEFTTTRRVEFAETDMAGIVHFSNFFRWMESAEHEFFRSLGLAVHRSGAKGYGFARVHASCDYTRAIRYQDLVEIRLTVTKKKRKAFGYGFVFVHLSDDGAEEIARGKLEVVCVARRDGEERLRAVDVPAEIAERVQLAPVPG